MLRSRGTRGAPGSRRHSELPRLIRLAIRLFGHRVSEPEIKLLLVVLFGLGGLATQAGSEAVLPAYVAGLVVAGVLLHDRVVILSAFVPTLIAQQLFRPAIVDTEKEEALGEEDLSIIHHRATTMPRHD